MPGAVDLEHRACELSAVRLLARYFSPSIASPGGRYISHDSVLHYFKSTDHIKLKPFVLKTCLVLTSNNPASLKVDKARPGLVIAQRSQLKHMRARRCRQKLGLCQSPSTLKRPNALHPICPSPPWPKLFLLQFLRSLKPKLVIRLRPRMRIPRFV
jgi:hypothetical protein